MIKKGNLKFDVGDSVFWASMQHKEVSETCPDCSGEGRLIVIMGDKTQHSIDCTQCSKAYESPSGKIYYYQYVPEIKNVHITGIDINENKVEYRIGRYIVKEENLFLIKKEAEIRAYELCKKHNNSTFHLQNAKELDKNMLYGKKTAGVTAGASTPDSVVAEFVEQLKAFNSVNSDNS